MKEQVCFAGSGSEDLIQSSDAVISGNVFYDNSKVSDPSANIIVKFLKTKPKFKIKFKSPKFQN